MTSCSSKKKEYEVIKESDPWYECSSFEISGLYPEDEYEYSEFETVGTTDDAIYIKAEAQKYFEGNYKNLTEEQFAEYYETSILKFSFDGKLLEKTDYITKYSDGTIRYLDKAWISDGRINYLESIINTSDNSQKFIYNDKEIDFSTFQNEYGYRRSIDYISDIYSSNGYTIFSLHMNSFKEFIYVERPDGTTYEVNLLDYYYQNLGDLIPADNGRVMIPAYIDYYGLMYLMLDPSTGEVTELEDIGTNEELYLVEFCNGMIFSRDFTGFSRMDPAGKMSSICEYSNIDASLFELIEAQLLYVADDNSEMILGTETYDSIGHLGGHSGYKITHLTRSDKNPHAGKTVLTLSTTENSEPDEADLNAVKTFNRQNPSYFIKYVFPYNEAGEYNEIDADIIIDSKLNASAADSNLYVDLAPYLELNDETYFMNAVNAAKTGDSLYHMPLDISATGIITASSNVPLGQTGFTFEEYDKFVDDVCNGIDPISRTPGYKMGKSAYFANLFMNMSELFIYDGKVHFDGEDFRKLIVFVDEHGSAEEMTELEAAIASVNEHNEAVMEIEAAINGRSASLEGKLGAVYGNFYSFENYIDCYSDYGDGLGIYGLPSFDGRGPMTISDEFVSISAGTIDVEPCIEFVKLLLSYDIQSTKFCNPINRDALRFTAEEKLEAYNSSLDRLLETDPSAGQKMTSDAIDKYIELLSSSYGGINIGSEIENILREESSAYFNGSKSLDDVIPVMQNRVQTVLNENK